MSKMIAEHGFAIGGVTQASRSSLDPDMSSYRKKQKAKSKNPRQQGCLGFSEDGGGGGI
ncbi:hypothetical protein [Aeromonas salmonicida]|uniref:hypothetical protein n=1 Tax=Aeromonas salmonicida TaxID=645 RepID=UPI0012FA8225|nr:hypothetical protein [Aeromonas salmonicida]